MTRMEKAKRGNVTDEFRAIAGAEHTTPEAVREAVAAGEITVCTSTVRGIEPVAIGKGLRIKVNAKPILIISRKCCSEKKSAP